MDKIRIVIADDHILVREGTRELLQKESDIEVVGEAGDGEETVRLVKELKPDVAIVDIAMPQLNGIEATKQIKDHVPGTAVLILIAYDYDRYIFAILEAGAAGYLQQVTRVQEEERKRIARELHDETLQNLIAISRQLEKITSSDALWEASLEVVSSLKKQIQAAVKEIRRFSHDLRPSVLDDLGLLPALELLSDDLEKQGLCSQFQVIGQAGRLAPEVETMLFRIAQEAARNTWRHAQASTAELDIKFRDSKVSLSISDDGRGFRVPQRPGDLASWGKLGLAGMYERARLLGGTLTLKSSPGSGTKVTVEVPV